MDDYREKSFWLETAGEYTERPPLEGHQTVDVAVVGGGFTGLSTALHLKERRPGLRVAVLESGVVGGGDPGRHRWIRGAELDANPALVRSMRVQPPRSASGGGRVRVVEVEGVDLQPCGGTHVARSGQLGLIKVLGESVVEVVPHADVAVKVTIAVVGEQ